MKKNYYLALFFFILQALIIYGNYPFTTTNVFFWFCNHIPIFFAIAFLTKNEQAVKGFINVGFLAQLVWTIDFLSRIIFGVNFLNITGYLFESDSVFQWITVLIIHILSTFLAFYYTHKSKPELKSLMISFFYLLALYFATLIFTDPELNINWVFMIGFGLDIGHPLYTLFWPAIVFFIIILPTHFIQYYTYLKFGDKKKSHI